MDEKRLDKIEARLGAVTTLLLSHITATETQNPGTAQDTIDMMETQLSAAPRRHRAILTELADQIRDVNGLPTGR